VDYERDAPMKSAVCAESAHPKDFALRMDRWFGDGLARAANDMLRMGGNSTRSVFDEQLNGSSTE
jgi:hypothetical protein